MSRHHRNHRRLPWRAWERLRRAALDRDDWKCTRCRAPDELEVHHVQALDRGGAALALANVETLCRGCHIGAHLDPERRAWRMFIGEAS